MAVPAVGQVYLVTLFGSQSNQTILSTLLYRLDAVGPAASVNDVYNTIKTQINLVGAGIRDKYLACCATNYQMLELWIQCVHPTRFVAQKTPNIFAGLGVGAAATANVASVITKRGENANRKNIGSLHVPSPDPSLIGTMGTITDPVHSASLLSLSQEMLLPILSGGAAPTTLVPVIANIKTLGTSPARVMTSTLVQTTIRVMRRRTVGLGI